LTMSADITPGAEQPRNTSASFTTSARVRAPVSFWA
jgi:hypothetical protein